MINNWSFFIQLYQFFVKLKLLQLLGYTSRIPFKNYRISQSIPLTEFKKYTY